MFRLDPVRDPLAPEIAAILAHYPRREGGLLQLFRVFANSARFLRKGTVNLLDRDSPLSMRLRELVILRTCAHQACAYEWGVHAAAFAEHVGLTPEQLHSTCRDGGNGPGWSAEEALLLRVVDALCAEGGLGADLRQAFQERWNQVEQLEILALCGNYHTVAFVANVAGLAPEPFAAPFPGRPGAVS